MHSAAIAASTCSDGRFGRTEEGTYTQGTLFETSKVKLTKVELGPGGILARHGHSGSELLIAVTRIHFTDATGSDIERDLGETQHTLRPLTTRLRTSDLKPLGFSSSK